MRRSCGSSRSRPCRSGGAAPARWLCRPVPGRSGVAVRPHYGGLPSVAGRGGMRGGESRCDLEGSSEESPSFPRRKHGPGDRNRRRWSAGRRLSPIARGKGTPRKRSGWFAATQEASQASAFPGALLPILVETRWKTGPARAFTNNRAGGALPTPSFRGALKARTRNPEARPASASGFRVRR